MAVFFGLLSLGWLLAPVAVPAVAAGREIVSAFVQTGAFGILLPVVIMAFMLPRRVNSRTISQQDGESPAARHAPRKPSFAASDENQSAWSPDITFQEAMIYLATGSRWGNSGYRSVDTVKSEMSAALRQNKVTSWGRAHPEGPEVQIKSSFWHHPDINWEIGYAFSNNVNAAAHAIRLSKGEIEAAWPPKK
ncbi:hypothetical protein [Tsuneonella sp. HG222]